MAGGPQRRRGHGARGVMNPTRGGAGQAGWVRRGGRDGPVVEARPAPPPCVFLPIPPVLHSSSFLRCCGLSSCRANHQLHHRHPPPSPVPPLPPSPLSPTPLLPYSHRRHPPHARTPASLHPVATVPCSVMSLPELDTAPMR
eukprot:352178-Chlamydomonas_euryale.AAC.8